MYLTLFTTYSRQMEPWVPLTWSYTNTYRERSQGVPYASAGQDRPSSGYSLGSCHEYCNESLVTDRVLKVFIYLEVHNTYRCLITE